jgi:ribosomal protein S18 acetylase RimI-like enzyme
MGQGHPTDTSIRRATQQDVAAIVDFSRVVVHPVYAALIDARYADELIATWWSPQQLTADIADDVVLVAESVSGAEPFAGFVHVNTVDDDPVMWKLYVHPDCRNMGVGARLVDAVIATLPSTATSLRTEHVAANHRAARFYEREGFAVESPTSTVFGPTDPVWRRRPL